jgi:pimeloyl-ACP methyl ester carboxylesterase
VGSLLALGNCSLDDRYFDPKKTDHYELGFSVIPASRVQELSFSSNGNTLFGVFVTAASVANGTVSQAPTVLYAHGKDDNIDAFWERMEFLDPLNYNLFIYDYQGYGKSSGEPSFEALRENSLDALNLVKSRSEVDNHRLIYYGYSLGGVFAIDLAANVQSPWVLILEAAPASSAALVKNGIQLGIPASFFFDENFDNIAEIKKISAPVLLFHGTIDDTVPFQFNAQELSEAANQPKSFVVVEGANHDDLPQILGLANYRSLIGNFVTNHGN